MRIDDIVYISAKGERISLILSDIKVTAMSGLESKALIKTTEIFGQNGTIPNYITSSDRLIDLTVTNFNHTFVSQAERVYGLFTVKEPFELILSNKEITRKISGIVQQVTPGSFTANDTFRIILYCGNPFFTDMENSVVSNLAYESGFEFELELLEPPALEFGRVRESLLSNLYNNGNIATGFTATFTTEHPCSGVGILNARTREYLRSTKPLLPYERIVFDTRTGQKTMYHYDVNNNETNILNTMQLGSTFFQLATGENPVLLQLQDGYTDHLSVVYEWDDYYAGI